MGLRGVERGRAGGKEVKGWIVKHKTDVCSGPGVTREGLRALRLPQSAQARLHPEAERLQRQAVHQHGDSSAAETRQSSS